MYEQTKNWHEFNFHGAQLSALPSGALWWSSQRLLCISDLHLGKAERVARRSGQSLPPYDTRETLARLSEDLETTKARTVVCLGDSFDDLTAANALLEEEKLWIARLQAGREWIWIEGNHDPGPVEFGGTHLAELKRDALTFRHIATSNAKGEVSGHYHPKARLAARGRTITRPAFLVDDMRLILPAYGIFTGGLASDHERLDSLMGAGALAILTGPKPTCIPMPR